MSASPTAESRALIYDLLDTLAAALWGSGDQVPTGDDLLRFRERATAIYGQGWENREANDREHNEQVGDSQ